jgi:transcription factor CRZ1
MLQQQQQAHFAAGSLQPVQQPMMINMDAAGGGGFALPAALLAQYPALSNVDWSAMPQGDDPGDLSDVGIGRSSFDASGGGDFGYDEGEINENYVGNNGMTFTAGSQGAW